MSDLNNNDLSLRANAKQSSSILKGYIIGLVACLILTVASFGMVSYKVFSGKTLIIAIAFFAFVQFLVQLKYFLHLSLKADARWDLISLIFTLIIAIVIVAGSIWIMFSLDQMMI